MVPNQNGQQQEQEQEEQQFDITQSPAAIITIVALSLLFLGAIAFFGYQTWLFINWLLPEDGLMMKVLAVVNFDVFSYVWLAVGLFLARWIQPLTRTLAVLAGIVTFLLSLGCSVIQMLIASAERFGANTNPDLVYTADAFIILALVWNISTLLGVVHVQWPYIIGYHPPKKPKKGRGFWGKKTPVQLQQQQLPSTSIPITQSPVPLPANFTDEQRALYEQTFRAFMESTMFPLPTLPPKQQTPGTPIQSEHIDTARWEAMLREMAEGMKTRMTLEEREAVRQQVIQEYSQQPPTPLAQPPLDSKASQPGTQNGANGHQSNKSQA